MGAYRFSRKEAEEYIGQIADRNNIDIVWHNGRDWFQKALAEGTKRRVTIPRPWNFSQLLVGLHEFGHLLGVMPPHTPPTADWDIVTRTILCEAAAWVWAIDHLPDHLMDNLPGSEFKIVGTALADHYWHAYTAHDHEN